MLVQHVGKSIVARRLFRRGEGVLVAVSGGLDSMVLLEVLARLTRPHRLRLVVAHFNHQLRGRSSDADERFVARAARRLGLRFVRGSADVRRHAHERGLSVEMAARELRHDFFARTAARLKIRSVALAHHADDQVELFFLRLLRGAGGEGLAGMKWRNPSPRTARIFLVRPLLDQPKRALREFAAEEGVRFREDATNAQLDIQRNRIRHELLPLLAAKYQPALDRVILREMEICGAEAEFVTEAAKDWLAHARVNERVRAELRSAGLQPACGEQAQEGQSYLPAKTVRQVGGSPKPVKDRRSDPAFAALPVAVQRRCLQIQAAALGLAVSFDLIERLRLTPDQPVCVTDAVTIWRDVSGCLHSRTVDKPGFNTSCKVLKLNKPAGLFVFDSVEITWKLLDAANGALRAPRKVTNLEQLDADKVGPRVILRHWQPGDRFQPIGMAAAVKLQDLFTNQKVLRETRHQLIVAATGAGELFWVEGLRLGERCKLDRGTRRRLQWRWKRL